MVTVVGSFDLGSISGGCGPRLGRDHTLVAHNVFGLSADHKARVQSPNPSPPWICPYPSSTLA